MARARASIGTVNYATAIATGHHKLMADEGPELGGMTLQGLHISSNLDK